MTTGRFKIIAVTAFLTVAAFLIMERSVLPPISARPSTPKGFELLGTIMRLIKTDYIEERDPARTVDGAYRGLVNSLDALSSYLDRQATAKYLSLDASFKDIGVILFKKYGSFPQVVSLLDNAPAAKSGIKVGDYLSALDDHSTLGMSLLETGLYLKDVQEKPVSVKVLRDSSTLWLKIDRALVAPVPVTYLSAGDPAVLRIHSLRSRCVDELRKNILPQIKKQKKPLVLDLRNCHEGEYDEAVKLLGLFLRGAKIGYFEKKGGAREDLVCPGESELDKIPLAVWVNPGTMGPAELVAGVLQDRQRCKVIGTETLGLVAKLEHFPLRDASSLLLTSAVFSLPSGKKLWTQGITPDTKIPVEDQSQETFLQKTSALLPNP